MVFVEGLKDPNMLDTFPFTFLFWMGQKGFSPASTVPIKIYTYQSMNISDKHLLRAYWVPGTVPSRDTIVTRKIQSLPLMEIDHKSLTKVQEDILERDDNTNRE